VDFGPHGGDFVLGGPNGFEGIQGTERIRRDLDWSLSPPCTLLRSVGVHALEYAFALLMLLGGTYAYSLRQISGGDLKLPAVASW
jgi:hypothetical protein